MKAVQIPPAPPASNKKKRKRKNKSAASSTVPTPTPKPVQQLPVKQQRPLPRYHLPEVDHRLAPLSIPGRAPALKAQQQQQQPQPPPPPATRGPATTTRPSAGAVSKKLSRREEQKGLSWKQRRSVMSQRRVEMAAVNAAAAASAPRLPSMVPLPPYLARQATVSTHPAQIIPPLQPSQTTPRVQTWRLQLPEMEFVTFGGPATSACPPSEGVLVDLSPPPFLQVTARTLRGTT